MPKVSTFCPRCGEAIETEVPEEARAAGRAALTCPSCRQGFEIAPAKRAAAEHGAPERAEREGERPRWAPGAPSSGGTAPSAAPVSSDEEGHEGPIRTTPPQIGFKPLAAGMMLIFVAVLGGWGGYMMVSMGEPAEVFTDMGGQGNLTARVLTPSGEPVPGVQVRIIEAEGTNLTGMNRTTNADGAFAFRNLPAGIYVLNLTSTDGTTVLWEAIVLSGAYDTLTERLDANTITMPADEEDAVRVSQVDEFEKLMTFVGYGTLILSLPTLLGGVAAMRRRTWWLALTGSITGIFVGFMFLLPAILALVSLVLLVLARKEFRATS